MMKLTRETLPHIQANGYADFTLPEKVLQFGDDDCVRGIVDWMIHRMNMKGCFEGRIVAVQPAEQGNSGKLNGQDGLYTLITRDSGLDGGMRKKEIVSSISRGLDPYTQFQGFMDCASNPELRLIISNTGETGIRFNPEDRPMDEPPSGFPAKATVFLLRRFMETGGDEGRGFIFLPCEPVFRNGDLLRDTILRYCEAWKLDAEFERWVVRANRFLNTLIDRIVTGYTSHEAEGISTELGYEDALLDSAESYHLLVLEGDKALEKELPFAGAGLNVVWTDDILPYWKRKQRILNGVYTMSVFPAFLSGRNTVRECLEDDSLLRFMTDGIMEEIIPSLNIPRFNLREYAAGVFDRFADPGINLKLLPVSAVSRFRDRVVPSIIEYMGRFGRIPEILSISFASLIAYYRGFELRAGALIGRRDGEEYRIMDETPVLEFFLSAWEGCDGSEESILHLTRRVLANKALWGMDLSKHSSLAETVSANLEAILRSGIQEAFLSREGIPA